ncbi:long-chain fatty acid--CoA ligase [Longimicrobium sp.]|jgi:long-chain acyl-CoA synthetase|uniref:AMP-dependent synthetase/ligase n=1 Tax=Longimicrobium sp. TaxID=2029185 RepID=UPI002ED9B345
MRQMNTVVPLRTVERDTIPKIFFGGIDRHGRDAAMMYKAAGQWHALSDAEVERRVTTLAVALSAAGVASADRVVVLAENRPEWAICDYAITGLGAITVPIYPTLPANQVQYIVADCGAKVVFVSNAAQAAKIREFRVQLPEVERLVAFEGAADGVESFADWLAEGERELAAGRYTGFRQRALSVPREQVATLIYTSGTTGNPKGVMLTHFNLAANLAACLQHGMTEIIRPGDVTLSFLPLSHVFERMVDYLYWDVGTTIAYTQVEKVADHLTETRPMVTVSVPRLFDKIYSKAIGAEGFKARVVAWARGVGSRVAALREEGREPAGLLAVQNRLADRLVFSKLRERTGGRVRAFVSGGAPLSPEVARFFLGAGLPVYEGYGLTETSPVIAVNAPGKMRMGTVGQPVPGVELAIEPSTGEILTRGPHVMRGYWNDPDCTQDAIDAEGWFHTGDIGELTADGYLRITDRLKNLIVTAGGKNVAPAPMENLAVMSQYISQAVMLGDRRAYPVMLVVPEWENLRPWAAANGLPSSDSAALAADPRVRKLLEAEVLSALRDFAQHERPKKIAVIQDEFTIESGMLTPTLKIKRKVVEQVYREVIEGLYGGPALPT